MGQCLTGEIIDGENVSHLRSTDSTLTQQIKLLQKEREEERRILFLGTAGGGKSTIFKQLSSIYGKGFTKRQKVEYLPSIFSNTIASMKLLVKHSKRIAGCHYNEGNEIFAERIMKTRELFKISPEIMDAIVHLWKDEGIRKTFENAEKFHCENTAAYFFDKIEEFMDPEYVPTVQDIMNVRIPSSGIKEGEIVIKRKKTVMVDVGGQRNERRKWIHSFQGVTALLFVCAINEYDSYLKEDVYTKSMDETLSVFEDVVNLSYFKHSQIILFLNKSDLFQEKYKRVPITTYFEDYDGDVMNLEEIMNFLKLEFRRLVHNKKRELYIHFTVATDEKNVRFTFKAIKSILLGESANDGAFM